MNIYEKLNQARCEFQTLAIKKSGKNSYANYSYFELNDILPEVNKLAEKLKFMCCFSVVENQAVLSIIDIEKEGVKIEFTLPMSSAQLRGCHEVQNLGAVQTYLKRYLYQNAFEIAECDTLDANTGKETPKGNDAIKGATKWTKEQLAEMKTVLETLNKNGQPIFTEDDKAKYNFAYKNGSDFSASLANAKEELKKRIANFDLPIF